MFSLMISFYARKQLDCFRAS